MNKVFQHHLRKFVLFFLDDILAYTRTWDDHVWHLDTMLRILRMDSLYEKDLGPSKLLYLYHIISAHGMCIDPKKIHAIIEWSTLENLK